jgi:hypothetical protein
MTSHIRLLALQLFRISMASSHAESVALVLSVGTRLVEENRGDIGAWLEGVDGRDVRLA